MKLTLTVSLDGEWAKYWRTESNADKQAILGAIWRECNITADGKVKDPYRYTIGRVEVTG